MAIIVTGFGLSKPKVVIGRGVFVIPIIQRADSLTAKTDRNIKIEGLPTRKAPEQKPEAPVQPKAEEAPTQSKRPEMFEKQ